MNASGRPLVLTMGEPAGICGEITLRAWLAREHEKLPPFLIIADPDWLSREAEHLGLPVRVQVVTDAREANAVWPVALPVMPQPLVTNPVYGKPDPMNAAAVIGSIRRAAEMTMSGKASALVTNPIQKSALYTSGFGFPGHTEYLASLAPGSEPVMMLAIEGLRVVPVTVHVPIAQVANTLTQASIIHAATITHAALQGAFAIVNPRLSVAGLNPHAGESGSLGREEIDVLEPAIRTLHISGISVSGPHPADTMFHRSARSHYDAAICMYHDQALIPLKTLDFDSGVNITLGLPFVRTSPDHGTALDIAGQGRANASSLIHALKMAASLAYRRNQARRDG